MTYNARELAQLLADVRRPHATNRDRVWDDRRDVRHRRKAPIIPQGLKLAQQDPQAFDYRTTLPEKVITTMKGKMGANTLTINVRMRGIQDERKKLGEKIENWLRGAHDALDPNGIIDGLFRDHQVATGIAWAELEVLPAYVPPPQVDLNSRDYDALLSDSREAYGLPFCLTSIDPRSIYWGPIDRPDRPRVVVKVALLPLYDVALAYQQEGFRLSYIGTHQSGRFEKMPLLGGEIPPALSTAEYNKLVRIVVIADDRYIYHLMFPTPGQAGASGIGLSEFLGDDPSSIPNLELLATYPNPFGRPPYFACIGRLTDDPDPAFRFKPLAAEVLDLAPYVNNIRTARLTNAWLESYKPPHLRPRIPAGEGSVQRPNDKPIEWRPDVPFVWDGDVLAIPSNENRDLDAFDQMLQADFNAEQASLMAALQSGALGRSTPAWTIMQMNEEQMSIVSDAQNSRAGCWRDILMAIIRCLASKADGPVYVSASSRDRRDQARRVEDMLAITPDDLREFLRYGRLDVSIGALTQGQRAAQLEFGQRLKAEGAISQETFEADWATIDDRVAEQARKDREAVSRPLKELAIQIGWMLGKEQLRVIYGPLVDQVLATIPTLTPGAGPARAPQEDQAPEQAGEEQQGAQTPLTNALRLPGLNMSLGPPQLRPRLLAQPQSMMNGSAP